MKIPGFRVLVTGISALWAVLAIAANVVPTEVQMPGTQPLEVAAFESPNKCDNCHAGYNNATTAAAGEGEPQDEPSTGWRGGTMGNAGRDPIFWATLAIAEQDFDGSGDLCIRCHSTTGWYGGRSTPTDASGLLSTDSDGVDCDTCHTMTNPDDSEHLGVMNSPFIANCSADASVPDKNCASPDEGFYGTGMLSLWNGGDKLGPYDDAAARHPFLPSKFHRDVDFCGSCHDVSNPVVGDLAPGHGALPGAPAVVSSRDSNNGSPNLGGPVEEKAAFNNPPYSYGVVERTFSEYKSSAFPTTRVRDFASMPDDLQVSGGSPALTHAASLVAGTGGDYADGDPRYFSCQSCHMRPVNSAGANKNDVVVRPDLPRHDHTGANYWFVDLIRYLDGNGDLLLGGNMTTAQFDAMEDGRTRATEHLQQAASLVVEGDTLKVINLTGHKLITGYPEGRRMWLNIRWLDDQGQLVREDGAYGPLVDGSGQPVMIENPEDHSPVQVESILDLEDPNLRVYEALYAITQDWAELLIAAGLPSGLVLDYDRLSGANGLTLGELASMPEGSYQKSFHFVLNNRVVSDNRIPPWQMGFDEARKRNVLPIPESQYGNPGPGGTYRYWDEIDLAAIKPAQAVSAEASLLYQGTTWEYVQFLDAASNGTGFLGDEGEHMLEAWINAEVPVAREVAGDRRMVPPYEMASTTWQSTALKYTIGGTVSGLEGSGLVLQNNGGDDLAITGNGGFTFDTALADGSGYEVSVKSQPSGPDQTCSVSSGEGTIPGANVTHVNVTCSTATYTVGGTVSGLEGSGLVLQNNDGDDLAITGNGGFTFETALADGSGYEVSVKSQPSGPDQSCTVSFASGNVSGANVTSVRVNCVTLADIIFKDGFEP